MRIDDLNRAPQMHEAAKTDAVSTDRAKAGGSSSPDPDSDSASISPLAANALNAPSAGPNDARLEALRVQLERGEYNVSAQDVAASIIDQHIVH